MDIVAPRSMPARVLPADSLPDERPAAARNGVAGIVLVIALALAVLTGGLYALIADREAESALESATVPGGSDPDAFRRQLTAHLAAKPRDGRAWVALARLDMDGDRFDDAAKHYAKALEVSTKIARDAGVLCEYADALGMAQGGRLAGRPAETIERALALDPAHPKALEMAGSAAYERGDFRAAAQHWRALLAQFPEGVPARVELAAAIERAERLASTTLPPASASAPRGS
jgi:cytochrome c-type biogenesis protein CcmH